MIVSSIKPDVRSIQEVGDLSYDYYMRIYGTKYTQATQAKFFQKFVSDLNGYKFVPKKDGVISDPDIQLQQPLPLTINQRRVTVVEGGQPLEWWYSGPISFGCTNPFGFFALQRGFAPADLSIQADMDQIRAIQASQAASIITDAAGGIEPGAQLLVDLAEIGDTINMCTSAKRWIKELPRAAKELFRLKSVRGRDVLQALGIQRYAHRTVKGSFKVKSFGENVFDGVLAGVNFDLMRKFGLEPLCQTISALWNWESEVYSRLEQLALLSVKPSLRRITRRGTYPVGVSVVGQGPFGVTELSSSCEVASGAWAPPMEYDTSSAAAARLTAQYLNLNQFVRTLWEAKSFSFVWDWIVSVEDIATAIDEKLFGASDIVRDEGTGRVSLIAPWSSHSILAQCYLTGTEYFPGKDVPVKALARFKKYSRSDSFASFDGLLNPADLSIGQYVTGGELLIQKLKRR